MLVGKAAPQLAPVSSALDGGDMVTALGKGLGGGPGPGPGPGSLSLAHLATDMYALTGTALGR